MTGLTLMRVRGFTGVCLFAALSAVPGGGAASAASCPATEVSEGKADNVEQAHIAATRSMELMKRGRYDEAYTLLRQGIDGGAKLGRNNVWIGILWHQLGSYYQDQGGYDASKTAYWRAVRIFERTGHPMLIQTAVSLGSLYLEYGETAQAERIWRNLLAKRVSELHDTDPPLALALSFRGSLLMARKNYAAAEPLLQHALDIWQLEFGPDEVRTVAIRNVLALLYAHMRRYDEAVRHARQAVDLLERTQGSAHPLLAKLYANLGAIYTAAGRGLEAEQSCRNALQIAKEAFGSDSPFTVSLLRAHAVQLRKLNRDEEAAVVERELRRIHVNAARGRGHTVDVRELGQ